MSLPASQQRALDAIDSHMRVADTRLASMFCVFTDLTRLEKMPRIETLQPARWWTGGLSWPWQRTGRNRLSALVLVPLLVAATLSLLLLTVLTTSPVRSGRCAQTTLFTAPVRLADTGCASGSAPHTGSAGG